MNILDNKTVAKKKRQLELLDEKLKGLVTSINELKKVHTKTKTQKDKLQKELGNNAFWRTFD